MPTSATAEALVEAARALGAQAERFKFKPPVRWVYNPLDYAWAAHAAYLRRYGPGRRRAAPSAAARGTHPGKIEKMGLLLLA
jgi:hypothetical protein